MFKFWRLHRTLYFVRTVKYQLAAFIMHEKHVCQAASNGQVQCLRVLLHAKADINGFGTAMRVSMAPPSLHFTACWQHGSEWCNGVFCSCSL